MSGVRSGSKMMGETNSRNCRVGDPSRDPRNESPDRDLRDPQI